MATLRRLLAAIGIASPRPVIDFSEGWWYSTKRGLHDRITHAGWCLPTDNCVRYDPRYEHCYSGVEDCDCKHDDEHKGAM
jgi:hypothetical protein